MGVSFLCPGHVGTDHRLELWFLNPADGEHPLPSWAMAAREVPRVYRRYGHALDELTLTIPGDQMGNPIDVPGHWRGWVYDGEVWDAVSIGW